MCVHSQKLFTSKLFTFVREAFSKEVPNKTTIHQLVSAFWVDACLQEGGGHLQHLL
jgi:hypothetical protein